jgi:hypothetical protein
MGIISLSHFWFVLRLWSPEFFPLVFGGYMVVFVVYRTDRYTLDEHIAEVVLST